MSCPHGNPIGGCDTCDEVDAAFEAGKRSALAEQPAQQQEPVAYIRKDQLQKAAQSPMLCEVTPEPRQDRIGIYTVPQPSKLWAGLTQDMVESCPYHGETLRGAFFDGWIKAEAAHGIKEKNNG